MNKLVNLVSNWIWQLPQNLIGLIYKLINNSSLLPYSNETSVSLNAEVYLLPYRGGVTLGKYIFVNKSYYDLSSVIRHECGHVKQSRILGPLYLVIIGIPSLLHACINNYVGCCSNSPKGYYHFYTESWANKLMGIK